jgi:hypothetical protein
VEGLFLIVPEAVVSADLVGVLVRLCSPESAVPVLTVARVARGKFVAYQFFEFANFRVV